MYQNVNKVIITELAKESYRSHTKRNFTAILAITLTTILITAFLTSGGSFLSTSSNAMEQAPGPGAHGSLTGDSLVYEKVLQLPQVESAGYVQNCSNTALRNNAFGGINTRLFAPDMNFYKNNMVDLITGTYPNDKNDILISNTLAETIGIEAKEGQEYTLQIMLQEGGLDREQDIPMNICGVYRNPLYGISSIYEEIYTSPDFIRAYNSELDPDKNSIYVELNNLNPLLLKTDISDKLSELKDLSGAKEFSSGKYSQMFPTVLMLMLPFFLFVTLLMLSGYFLIYNIFYISILADIRWFGMMKTIGTTSPQLKRILKLQIYKLSIIGIIIGIISGYLLSEKFIAPAVMELTEFSIYYKAPSFLPVAFFSAVFSWMTVKISSGKPLRIASRISPIEALRYTAVKNKNIFTIISFTLSGIIFLAASNAVLGYQVDVFADRYNQNDYSITHNASLWDIEEVYQPISQQLPENISSLPFISDVDLIYMARTNDTNLSSVYPPSMGEIKANGKLWTYFRKLLGPEISNIYMTGISRVNERNNLELGIAGIPAVRWETEMENYNVISGDLDMDLFATGEYVVFQEQEPLYEYYRSQHNLNNEIKKEDRIHAGDVLEISFYDNLTGQYHNKKLKVMAVIEAANEYTSSTFSSATLILPDNSFKEIYSGYKDLITGIEITAKQDLNKDQVAVIKELINQEHSTQLFTGSMYQSQVEGLKNKNTFSIIGFFLSALLLVIGISNIVNTVTADILSKKSEYATMQSIGMTKKQLFYKLIGETMKFCGVSLVLMLAGGFFLGKAITEIPLFTGFNLALFLLASVAVIIIVLSLCALLSGILVHFMNKKSVVERLREIE